MTAAMPVMPVLTPTLGKFMGPADVRRAVRDTLVMWAPTYLAEAQRRTAALNLLDPLVAAFSEWVNQPGIEVVNPGNVPRYVVTVPGSVGTPRRAGDGSYRATWRVVVDIWLYGPDYQTTEDLLGWYVTALRELLVQHASLGGFAETTQWVSEQYGPAAPPTAFHSWGRASLTMAVSVDGMMSAYAGPGVPPADPTVVPVGVPAVTGTNINVVGIPLGGTL